LDRRPLLGANSVKWGSRKIDQSLGNVVHVLHDVRDTLKNVAAYASAESPERIIGLINDLSEIEGRNGNLRDVLFELLAAYLARRDAVSIDMGVRARDPETGNFADIDVLKVTHQSVSPRQRVFHTFLHGGDLEAGEHGNEFAAAHTGDLRRHFLADATDLIPLCGAVCGKERWARLAKPPLASSPQLIQRGCAFVLGRDRCLGCLTWRSQSSVAARRFPSGRKIPSGLYAIAHNILI
jgi:hypothetical protein